MGYLVLVKRSFPLWMLLMFCSLSLPAIATEQAAAIGKDNPHFIDLLEYEIQNRAFALKSVGNFVENRTDQPDYKVWQAYLKLEQLNQKKYQAASDKFNIPLEATVFTKVKVHLGSLGAALCPDSLLGIMKDATIVYVDKLKELEALSANEDKVFFNYVVLQEKVQEQALIYLVDGEIEQAAAAIENFVVQYEQ